MTQPTVPPNDARKASHVAATPSSGPFDIDFPFMNLGEIVVELLADGALIPTILVYGSQYSVAATPQEDGSFINGVITLVTPVANTTVTRFRNTFIQRLSNYPLTGYFDRLSLNAEMNRFVMCMQDFQRRLVDFGGDPGGGGAAVDPVPLRLLQTPASEAPVNVVANLIATRGSKILAWDASGNLINSSVTMAAMETVVAAGVPNLGLYAPLASPVLTGNPTAPTPNPLTDNDTSIATTQFVRQVVALGPTGDAGGDLTGTYPAPQLVAVVTPGTLGGTARYVTITLDAKGRITSASDGAITALSIGAAPLDSPVFIGVPTVPDPAPANTNNQTAANTKFVNAAVAGAVGGTIPTGPAGGDLDSATTYPAPLIKSSVSLRGAPVLATVVPPATNSQAIATTAYVRAQAYQTIAGMPTSLPPSGTASGVLSGSYPNPSFARGVMQLYDEVVLVANAVEMRVNIPAGAKAVELWFSTYNVANVADALMVNALNGAAIQSPAGHTTQYLYGTGGTAVASVVTTNGFQVANAIIRASGVFRPSWDPVVSQLGGTISGMAHTSLPAFYALASSFNMGSPIVIPTGYRLASVGGTNFLAGSYLRSLVMF